MLGADSGQLRVTSYNILADLYADSDYSRTVLFAQVVNRCSFYICHPKP